MSEAGNTATVLSEKIASLRSLEDKLRRAGAISLAGATFAVTMGIGVFLENNKSAVDTASRIAQDYNYGQYKADYANVEANYDQSSERTDSIVLTLGGFLLGGLGAVGVGQGAYRLSKARRYGNQADLLEVGYELNSLPPEAPEAE
jgi:hypothetical protein